MLQLPTPLPDGSTLLMDSDFEHRLRSGDATVGWTGDERLYAAFNPAEDRIEVWRWCEDDTPRLVARSRPGMRVLDAGLLAYLAAHDSQSRRAFDAGRETIAHNERILAARSDAATAAREEAADRLHLALRQDAGALYGGLSKRLYSFGPKNGNRSAQ
jgi:hypothetical protein